MQSFVVGDKVRVKQHRLVGEVIDLQGNDNVKNQRCYVKYDFGKLWYPASALVLAEKETK